MSSTPEHGRRDPLGAERPTPFDDRDLYDGHDGGADRGGAHERGAHERGAHERGGRADGESAGDAHHAGADGARAWTDEQLARDRAMRGATDIMAMLLAFVDALRRAAPRELQEQLTALLRETLLTVRALIDRYLERLDRGERETRVEDIPID